MHPFFIPQFTSNLMFNKLDFNQFWSYEKFLWYFGMRGLLLFSFIFNAFSQNTLNILFGQAFGSETQFLFEIEVKPSEWSMASNLPSSLDLRRFESRQGPKIWFSSIAALAVICSLPHIQWSCHDVTNIWYS